MKNELIRLRELLNIPSVKSFSENNRKFNKQLGKYTLESFKNKIKGNYDETYLIFT